MSRKNPSYTERQRRFMCADYGRKKAGKKTRTSMTKAQLREFCRKPLAKKGKRGRNPHLTSGKWRYVGLFKKSDIKAVKRILQIHGIAHTVTSNRTGKLEGRGYRELYVTRDMFDLAYRAITRLFEGSMAT